MSKPTIGQRVMFGSYLGGARRSDRSDRDLRYDFSADLEASIRRELETEGRATPTFEYGYYLRDGSCCSVVRNTVAIQPKGYRKAATPAAPVHGL
jgi:hypothetical protein